MKDPAVRKLQELIKMNNLNRLTVQKLTELLRTITQTVRLILTKYLNTKRICDRKVTSMKIAEDL
jgi:hypothetical protein